MSLVNILCTEKTHKFNKYDDVSLTEVLLCNLITIPLINRKKVARVEN